MPALTLVAALAIAENVVRLQFSEAIYTSGLLDVHDGLDPSHYTLAPVAGSVGLDGSPARPVAPVAVAIAGVPGAPSGVFVNITLDRPMTPYASTYSLAAAGLVSADLSTAVSGPSVTFPGVFRGLVVPSTDLPVANRDFANPQTSSGANASGAVNLASLSLGTFPIDSTGDYATDQGMTGFKKRVFRRIFTVAGGFLHLGRGYGVGATTYGKKLATAARKSQFEAACESQISLEPEVAKVRVSVLPSVQPGFFGLSILIRLKTGPVVKYQGQYPMM